MANPFYTFIRKMFPGLFARAQDVNEQLEAIETAFDEVLASLENKVDLPVTPAAREQNLLGFNKTGDPIAYGGHLANRVDKWAGWDETGQLVVKDAPDGEPGEVGVLWQGLWLPGANYIARSAVSHVSPSTGRVSSWFTLNGAAAGQEPGLSFDWELMAQEGQEGPVGPEGPPGTGLIAGGTARQVIIKQSATDFDADWELLGIDSLNTAATDFNAVLVRDGTNDFGLVIPAGGDEQKVLGTDGSNQFHLTRITTNFLADNAVNRFKIADGEVRVNHIPLNEIPLDRLKGSSAVAVTRVNQAPATPDGNTIGATFDLGNKQLGKLRAPMDGSNRFLPTVLVARLDTALPLDEQNVYDFRQIDTAFITNRAVTYAKMQNVNANRLLGRVGSVGSAQELQLGAGLTFDGTTLRATGGATGLLALGRMDTPIESDENNTVTLEYQKVEVDKDYFDYSGGFFSFVGIQPEEIYEITVSAVITGRSETDQGLELITGDGFDGVLVARQFITEPTNDNTVSYTFVVQGDEGGFFLAIPTISVRTIPSGAVSGFTVENASIIIKRIA